MATQPLKNDLPLVVLVGQTNVGKSTLMNALAGYGRTVVAREANTTRDVVDEVVRLGHRDLRLVDTAGLGRGSRRFAAASKPLLEAVLQQAAVIVLVLDCTVVPDQADRQLLRYLRRFNKPLIAAVNKSDKQRAAVDWQHFERLGIEPTLPISAAHKTGFSELGQAIAAYLPSAMAPRRKQSTAAGPVKIAFIGRPNVGKSSLFNRLLGSERAIIDPAAGTTRDAVRAELVFEGHRLELADTAGLRRRGKIEVGIEKFSTSRTHTAIDWADVCVLVLDATELGVKQDQHLAGLIKDAGRGLILAVNKIDAAHGNEDRSRILARLRSEYDFVWWAPVVLVSAVTGRNVTKLPELALQITDHRQRLWSTPQLNHALTEIVAHHPPASIGRGRAHLRYMTQTDTAPPTFTLFGSRPSSVHYSYRRYLENQLRDRFEFSGTPIRLVFKDKSS